MSLLKELCCVSALYQNGLGSLNGRGIKKQQSYSHRKQDHDVFTGSKVTHVSVPSMMQKNSQARGEVHCNEYVRQK